MNKRKIKFQVMTQRDIGFCGEARAEMIVEFDTYLEAEAYCLEDNCFNLYPVLWIQKSFVEA